MNVKYKKMKKFLFNTLLSAIALAGCLLLTACSDKDSEGLNTNPTPGSSYVPVQFVFNVGMGTDNANGQTRMSAQTVQAGGDNFRGIYESRILAYHQEDANGSDLNGRYVSKPTKAMRMFNVSEIVGSGELSKANSTRVIELSMPNGTNSLMFYGRAPKETEVDDVKKSHMKQGYVRAVVVDDNSEDQTKFMLMPRISQYVLDEFGQPTAEETDDYKRWTQVRKLVSRILTRVARNGLEIQHYDGVEDIDRRARVWWPVSVNNYQMDGPSISMGGEKVIVTSENSNIADVGEGTEDVAIELTDGTPVGNYVASTKRLKTNLDTYTLNIVTMAWKELGAKVTQPDAATANIPASYHLSPLEEILGRAYNSFTGMIPGEIRAGAVPAVTRMIQDLWSVSNQVLTATPTYYQEAVAQAMSQRLYTRFDTYFIADIDAKTGIVTNCQFKSPKELVAQLKIYDSNHADEDYSILKDETDIEDFNEFPMCHHINMPPGGTQLSVKDDVDGYKKFEYNETMAAYGMGMTDVSPLKYSWPVELLYYGNSPVRTSDQTFASMDFPQNVQAWNDDKNWDVSWDAEYVKPTTRSVAMKYNISYGTALLDTRIYYKSSRLKDNNEALHGEPANELLVGEFDTDGNHQFELTGIVIGGQPKEVRWDFLCTQGERNYMIYDNEIVKGSGENVGKYGAYIPGYNAAGNTSVPNYTMVWDNWNPDLKGMKQEDVYIALEFRNCSGRDFWGSDNLIVNGGYFYLIGKLDPNMAMKNGEMTELSQTDLSEGITWPADRALPPFDANGNTIKERRVFMQGFKTLAKFGIGETSLQKAYLTVPDLRSANISLGLTVDLEWKDGLQYDVELGK